MLVKDLIKRLADFDMSAPVVSFAKKQLRDEGTQYSHLMLEEIWEIDCGERVLIRLAPKED